MKPKKAIKKDLEWRKPMFFQVGVFLALAMVLFAFEKVGSLEKETTITNTSDWRTGEIDVVVTVVIPETPPPAKTPPSTAFEIVENDKLIVDNLDVDAEVEASDSYGDYAEIEDVPEESNLIDDFILVPEILPEYPGGEDARLRFLLENTIYPRPAREAGIQGRVLVSFIVEKDGSLSNVEVIRGPAQSLNEEAVRVVKLMPKWKPGMQRGKAARVKYQIPINFILN